MQHERGAIDHLVQQVQTLIERFDSVLAPAGGDSAGVLTVQEAARVLKVSGRTIRRLIYTGRLKAATIEAAECSSIASLARLSLSFWPQLSRTLDSANPFPN